MKREGKNRLFLYIGIEVHLGVEDHIMSLGQTRANLRHMEISMFIGLAQAIALIQET